MRYIDKERLLAAIYSDNPEDVMMYIANYPAADVVEVRHGRWIQNPDYREWDYCSVCRIGTKRREYGLRDDGTEWVTEASYTYCPNCGARMDGDTDD